MKIGEGTTIIVKLSNWVESLSLSVVPNAACHADKRCLIDTLGVAVVGSRMPFAACVHTHVAQHYSKDPCIILGKESYVSSMGAALPSDTFAHVLDYDDRSYPGPVHASTANLPAVLTACEQFVGSSKLFLEAFIAGSEVEYALSWTQTKSHWLSGRWATGTLGSIGAAAGKAKMLGLATDELTAATALAVIQANIMVTISSLFSRGRPLVWGWNWQCWRLSEIQRLNMCLKTRREFSS